MLKAMHTRNIIEKARILQRAEVQGRPVPGIAWVRSGVRHRLHTVTLAQCAAVLVAEGRKLVFRSAERLAVVAGELLLIPAQTEITLENIPDPASGRYTALVIMFEEGLLARVAAAMPGPVGAPSGMGLAAAGALASWRVAPDESLAAVLAHLLDLARLGAGERILDLSREQLLQLLGEQGVALPHFWSASASWRARCAALISADPGREWCAGDVSRRLGVSERSLRRLLSGEDTGLRELTRDVRLNVGLCLLQSGRVSVGEAADRCGYASASRFSERFRERFGLRPSELLRQEAGAG